MNRQANMYRALAALAVLALLLVIAAFPLRVHAEGEVPSDPEPVKPPPIVGINTRVTLSEGDKGEIDPSGMLTGLDIDIPFLAEPPHYVEVVPQKVERKTLLDPSLAVPQRYQEAGEVTCGAAALGMALEYAELGGEGGSAPSTAALVADLRKAGLLYEVGTGVEELAYVAREHGYRGTSAFHGWTLAQLREQLEQGRPVVVALGANGQGKPGHFVTVTGISEDGGWVSYNDPTFGARTVPTSEFLRQWGLQGNSGLVVRESPLPAAADPMLPWMGLFGALSMMAVLVGRESAREDLKETYYALRKTLSDPRRMGLGGRLGAGSPAGGTCREPVYGYKAVQRGYKTVEKEVPVYETKQVKTGYKVVTRRVPNYVTRKIQVGMKRVTRRVPRYVEKRVRVGTKKVTEKVKVTRYRTEPYYEWKKETRRVPVYRTRKYVKYYKHKRVKDWKLVRKYGRLTLQPTYRWKRVPVYGKRKVCVGWKTKTEMKRVKRTRVVPYTAVETRTKKVPVFETRRVQDGYRTVNEIVPVYDFRTFQEGWKTVHESVPVYEEERVQVGTEIVIENVPNYEFVKVQTGWKETPPPPSTPTPTPGPMPVPMPKPYATPYPESFGTTNKDTPELEGKWVSRGLRWVKTIKNALTARAVAFNTLKSGHVSVSAPSLPIGTRRGFLQKYGFKGTRYNSSTITGITGRHLVSGAMSKGSWITAGVTSLAGNVIDYGFGKNKDKGIASQEFAVSSAVDTVMAVGTGLVAAAFIAGLTAFFGLTLPVWGAIGFTAGAGTFIGGALDFMGAGDYLKKKVNKAVDAAEVGVQKLSRKVVNGAKAWKGIADNAKVIGNVLSQRAKDKVKEMAKSFNKNTNESIEKVNNIVNQKIKNTTETVGSFVSSLFGGG